MTGGKALKPLQVAKPGQALKTARTIQATKLAQPAQPARPGLAASGLASPMSRRPAQFTGFKEKE